MNDINKKLKTDENDEAFNEFYKKVIESQEPELNEDENSSSGAEKAKLRLKPKFNNNNKKGN